MMVNVYLQRQNWAVLEKESLLTCNDQETTFWSECGNANNSPEIFEALA